eukprot:403374461
MAFVSQSPRKILALAQSSTSQNLGPGDYTNDMNTLSKSASVQRKQPAFGFGEERKLGKTKDTNQITPGPGAYLSHNELASAAYDKKLDDHTSYIIKDNGHLNQRTQQYAFQTTRDSSLKMIKDTPGPGSYDISKSTFSIGNNQNHIMQQYQGMSSGLRKKNSLGGQISPKTGAAIGLSGFLNMSIPSIPSRYIQPNLDIDDNEMEQSQTIGLDGALTNGKVKMITNDSSRLGPGTYQISDYLTKKSPRANLSFGISKTMRTVDDTLVKQTTNSTVGPGSYEITKELDRKIYNPTIPRDGINQSVYYTQGRKYNRNNGSIKDNYDIQSESDDEDSQEARKREKQKSPGPGQYLSQTYINTLGKDSQRPQQYQFFGSSIERFKVPSSCTNGIGPGAYNSEVREDRNKHFQFAGSSSFMGITRAKDNPMLNKNRLEIPGPGDYKQEDSLRFMQETKIQGKHAFQSNIDRFKVRDEAVPGPGKYPLPSSMNIRSATQVHASFRSGVKKELVFKIDKDIPGTGVYNTQDFKSIGLQKISGGAPNNFSLLAKKQLNHSQIRHISPQKEQLNVSPRTIINEISTPAAMGPGYYGGSKFKILDGQPKLIQDSKQFGSGDRFPDPKSESPGPGAYANLNKWHQKTYNLKFLNVQMSPQASNNPSAL